MKQVVNHFTVEFWTVGVLGHLWYLHPVSGELTSMQAIPEYVAQMFERHFKKVPLECEVGESGALTIIDSHK